MKGKIFIILMAVFLSIVFFTQFKLINKPVTDNDEGIYLTSFLLVDKGYSAYKQTYFSQPPGFLLSVYPGFILFGKTLQAARLTISLWSIIGLLAILWLGFELKNKWSGLLAVSLLLIIPTYYNQSLTFQSDILITTFSMISFVGLIRYIKSHYIPWFIISVFFLNLSLWTKFDITFIPSYILILFFAFKEKEISLKKIINLLIIFFTVGIGFFILLILPFGIREVFNNSILLRFQAAETTSKAFLLVDYLKKDLILLSMISAGLILSIFKIRKFNYLQKIIFIWSIFILILLIFYRPLFSHHLAILVVPTVLLFSQVIGHYLINKYFFRSMTVIILAISLGMRIYLTIGSSTKLVDNNQQKAIEIIKEHTNPDEIIISDEEILSGLSGRLPPPELSDISYVRIRSNNLTPEDFKKIIYTYKPKLIIPWNGRLRLIKNFEENLIGYKLLTSFSGDKNIYIRIAP
ncbi:hypothetical protein C4559_00650 [Candidatus Microgenomates bacterium]|nr:MAG: hypothetical protein C4559_00650 [Candidatus Microgenomates bacterium]